MKRFAGPALSACIALLLCAGFVGAQWIERSTAESRSSAAGELRSASTPAPRVVPKGAVRTSSTDTGPARIATMEALPRSLPPSAAAADAPSSTLVRVRIDLVLDDGADAVPALAPELLRIDAGGRQTMVASATSKATHPLAELARRAAAGEALPQQRRASETFEVTEPGRYATAWYAWQCVSGTRTWRPLRGTGPELEVRADQRELVCEIAIAAEALRLDPSFDAPVADPIWHATVKDG